MRAAIDFETYEWTKPFLAGFAWEGPNGVETAHLFDEGLRDSDGLVERALQYMGLRSDISEWWAHNGGKFDGLFLSAAAIRLGWDVRAHVAGGSRAIYFRFAKGDATVHLLDSYAVVPSRLGHKGATCNGCCACDFELPSRKSLKAEDYAAMESKARLREALQAPGFKAQLLDGCLTDARLVLELLNKVESLLTDWGGQLRATFSASALTTVKAGLADRGIELPLVPPPVNEWCRAGYYGARVEVLHHAPSHRLTEVDVNSSYPWAMTQSLPFEPLGTPKRLQRGVAKMLAGETEGLIRAQVTVPSMPLPPLPFRDGSAGGIYFPVGKWEAVFPACELRYAQTLGVKVKALDAIAFTVASPFKDFIESVYQVKATAKGAKRTFAKLLLNGCYGKFGQAPEQEVLRVFPNEADAIQFAWQHPGKVAQLSAVDRRFVSQEVYRWPRHTHYALASYITAHARILLHRALVESDAPAYCDSDSVHARGVDRLPQGNGLGEWKLELEGYRGRFYAPKIYELVPKEGQPIYAAKGFPVNAEAFKKLVAAELVPVERMQLLKSQLRKGDSQVARVNEAKRWSGRSMKRHPHPDGSTRPWTVKELDRGEHLTARCPLLS